MSLFQVKPVADSGAAQVANKRILWEGDIFGNNNYQGGDLYTASQFGMSGIVSAVFMGRDNTNTYTVAAIFPSGSQNNNEAFAPAPANFTAHWYAANGTEQANSNNLAASSIRAQIWGL